MTKIMTEKSAYPKRYATIINRVDENSGRSCEIGAETKLFLFNTYFLTVCVPGMSLFFIVLGQTLFTLEGKATVKIHGRQ